MAAGNRSGRGGADETGAGASGLARGSQEGPVRIRRTEGTRGRGPRGTTGRIAPAEVRPEDAPKISGEKSVRRTGATVPVKPTPRSKADEPMPAAAVDRRRQVIGTDDPKTRPTEAARRPQAGRGGKGAKRGKGR